LDPCGPVYITVGDGGNREKMAITHADEPSTTTPDDFMGGFCAFNFTSGPAAGNFCWDYSAFRESSFGHGILEVYLIFLSLCFTLLLWTEIVKTLLIPSCYKFNSYCIHIRATENMN